LVLYQCSCNLGDEGAPRCTETCTRLLIVDGIHTYMHECHQASGSVSYAAFHCDPQTVPIFWAHLDVCIQLGLPWPNLTPPFPPKDHLDTAATSCAAPPLRVCFCFKGLMADVKSWAGCMRSLTQLVHTPATSLIAQTWCKCC
jgi:hypothetical protein